MSTTSFVERRSSDVSECYKEKVENMKPGDPLDLLKGISEMFVSYEPHFGFENTLDFSENPRSKYVSCTLITLIF